MVVSIDRRYEQVMGTFAAGYHARASERHRYFCVAIPKNGCTTTKRVLHHLEGVRPESGAFHEDFAHLNFKFLPAEVGRAALSSPDWLRFCFVRNPYDRVFSAWKSKLAALWDPQYQWISARVRDLNGYPPGDGPGSAVPPFRDFVRLLVETDDPDILSDGHYDRQTNVALWHLVDYDVVGRFETFVDDLTAILRRLDAPPDIVAMASEVTNSTPKIVLAAAYDRELADLVYRHYEADFEAFGYERDSWLYM